MKIEVVERIVKAIMIEAFEASARYPAFNSAHEGYAVLLEEVEELKAEVFKKQQGERDNYKLNKEAVQVGAMAVRFIYDIVYPTSGLYRYSPHPE